MSCRVDCLCCQIRPASSCPALSLKEKPIPHFPSARMACYYLQVYSKQLFHRCFAMNHRKRLVSGFFLFVYFVVQLALFQSKRKHYPGISSTNSTPENSFLLSVDVLLLVLALSTFILAWLVRSSYESHHHLLRGAMVGLLISWIMIGWLSTAYDVNLAINLLLLALLLVCEGYSAGLGTTDVITVKRIEMTYNTLQRLEEGTEELPEMHQPSDGNANPDAGNGHPSDNDRNASYPINLATKGICNGFRINLKAIPAHNTLPCNLSLAHFAHLTHLVDSSSCAIYTALWGHVPVVVKVIKEDRVSNAVALQEFEMEEELLSRVRHRNIIRLLGELPSSHLIAVACS